MRSNPLFSLRTLLGVLGCASLALGVMEHSAAFAAEPVKIHGRSPLLKTLIRSGGDFLRMPDLLYARGYCFAAAGQPVQAEKSYLAAIELFRTQGVKSGEIRATVALAQQLIGTGRNEGAHRLLRPLVNDAGDETSPDVSSARSLLG